MREHKTIYGEMFFFVILSPAARATTSTIKDSQLDLWQLLLFMKKNMVRKLYSRRKMKT